MEQYVEGMEVATIASRTADDLLEELELSIMESSIRDQIQNGFNTSRDFLATVLNKFNAINEYADDDSARGIRSEMVDWANSLVSAIVTQYNLGYNNLDSESLDVLDVLESLYHFFVLDRHNNVIEFYKQYIDMHKREIAEQMNLSAKNGDIWMKLSSSFHQRLELQQMNSWKLLMMEIIIQQWLRPISPTECCMGKYFKSILTAK